MLGFSLLLSLILCWTLKQLEGRQSKAALQGGAGTWLGVLSPTWARFPAESLFPALQNLVFSTHFLTSETSNVWNFCLIPTYYVDVTVRKRY